MQFIHQFLIGVVMAVLVHLTRTVWSSVIFHFCNNALVILYEFTYVQAGWTFSIPWWVYLIMFVVGVPAVAALLYAFGRHTVRVVESQVIDLTRLSFSSDSPTAADRMRRVFDAHGEYVPYLRGHNTIAIYLTFALVGLIWLLNTISGWIA